MKLSTKSRYGTRLLMELARHWNKGPMNISEISKNQDISVKYLEQLIRPLKKAGFVESVRGAMGGHILVKEPEKITLGRVVQLLEDQTDLTICIGNPETCAMADECRVRLAWGAATQTLYQQLDNVTIADLIQ